MTALAGVFVVETDLDDVGIEPVLGRRDPGLVVCCVIGAAFPFSVFLRIGGGEIVRVKADNCRLGFGGVPSLDGSFVARIPVKAAGLTVSLAAGGKSSFSLLNFCLFLLPFRFSPSGWTLTIFSTPV
jgi:hypothetical protein